MFVTFGLGGTASQFVLLGIGAGETAATTDSDSGSGRIKKKKKRLENRLKVFNGRGKLKVS